EVLPQNGAMLAVFREAGYEVTQELDDGLVTVRIDLDPGERSREVMADREHRAGARSMRALWEARRVLVVGPGGPEGLDARRARARGGAGGWRAAWSWPAGGGPGAATRGGRARSSRPRSRRPGRGPRSPCSVSRASWERTYGCAPRQRSTTSQARWISRSSPC